MAGRVPNIDRLLKTFRYEKTPDVPNLELSIESRAVEHFIGQRKRMGVLEPEARVRLAEATGGRVVYPLNDIYSDVSGYLSTPSDEGNYALTESGSQAAEAIAATDAPGA
mgnify:CR=1 FL=1